MTELMPDSTLYHQAAEILKYSPIGSLSLWERVGGEGLLGLKRTSK